MRARARGHACGTHRSCARIPATSRDTAYKGPSRTPPMHVTHGAIGAHSRVFSSFVEKMRVDRGQRPWTLVRSGRGLSRILGRSSGAPPGPYWVAFQRSGLCLHPLPAHTSTVALGRLCPVPHRRSPRHQACSSKQNCALDIVSDSAGPFRRPLLCWGVGRVELPDPAA